MADAQSTTKPLLSPADALSLVAGYFPQEWATTNVEDVRVSRVTGGLINTLHLAQRDNTAFLEPAAVLIRHFGCAAEPSDLEKPEEPPGDNVTLSATDQAIFYWEMGPRGWGPNIYGLFEGGRLEEYIDAHTLTAAECTQPAIARDVARSYARLHSLRLHFEPDNFNMVRQEIILDGIGGRRDAVLQTLSAVDDPRARRYAAIFRETNWIDEIQWVADMFKKHNCQITITHGDSNHMNILIKNYESECRAMLIDYETAAYSYRGIDIGGHFNERMYCYNQSDTQLSGYPAPDLEQQKFWCEAYLQEWQDLEQDVMEYDTVDHLMMEASIGRLYHLLLTNMICTVWDEVELDPLFLSGLTHMMEMYVHLKVEFVERSSN